MQQGGAGPREADHDQRRLDALVRDARIPFAVLDQPQPPAQHAHHLAERRPPVVRAAPVGGVEERHERLQRAAELIVPEVVQPGLAAGLGEQRRRVRPRAERRAPRHDITLL